MKKLLILLYFIFFLLLTGELWAQSSYTINFSGKHNDIIARLIKGSENEFVAIRYYYFADNDTNKFSHSYIYSLDYQNKNDSIKWPVNFEREDTTIVPRAILFDSNCYIVTGSAQKIDANDSVVKRLDFFAKYDLDKNTVWEKFYERPDPLKNLADLYYNNKLMKLSAGKYLYSCRLWRTDEPTKRVLLRSFNSEGGLLNTKYFSPDLSGNINAMTYNIDSSAVLLHMLGQIIPCCNHLYNGGIGALVLDTATLDTIGGICYMQNFRIDEPYDAKLDGFGYLILAGVSDIFNFNTHKFNEYLGVYKLDESYVNPDFQPVKHNYLTNKDTTYLAGMLDCMDINSNGEIFIAGVVNNTIGPWSNTYDKIYVVKLDNNLTLLKEQYYGGDAFYKVLSMTGLDDGGIAISGIKYDYLVNNFEEDGFIIKTDVNLLVNTQQNNAIPVHSALVYPNPGNENLYVRTTEKGSVFMLYNLSGNLIKQIAIKQHVTELDCSLVAKGVYVWKLFKDNREIDYGKWIKIN